MLPYLGLMYQLSAFADKWWTCRIQTSVTSLHLIMDQFHIACKQVSRFIKRLLNEHTWRHLWRVVIRKQKRLQFPNELLMTSVMSTQVFWQIVPNSWCSNTETSGTIAFFLCESLTEFYIIGWSQHCTTLDRSNWTTDACVNYIPPYCVFFVSFCLYGYRFLSGGKR